MERNEYWCKLTWRHPVWDLVRYYRALRGKNNKTAFLKELSSNKSLSLDAKTLPILDDVIQLFFEYLDLEDALFEEAQQALRLEDEALAYCNTNGYLVGTTKTQSKDHHQSSKAMIAAVSSIAQNICTEKGLTLEPDPQNRCIWLNNDKLHVTSRNLDGAIPGLANPTNKVRLCE